MDGSANTGPSWLNLYGYERSFSDGTTAVGDENYIRESILYPNAKIVAGYPGAMPSFQGLLNDQQLDGLIAYMKSLSDKGPAPAAEGESAEGADAEATDETTSDAAPEGEG